MCREFPTPKSSQPVGEKKLLKYAFPLAALSLVAACADSPDQPAATLPWDQAVDLIYGGEVVSAVQAHSRLVTLSLRDGSTETTIEPEIDDLFEVIRQCGSPCESIALASE